MLSAAELAASIPGAVVHGDAAARFTSVCSDSRQIRAGCHLIVDGRSQGWISSATQSVVDPGWIGLGLLRDGETHIGSVIVAANPLMGEEVSVKVVSPHGYDAENLRVRA